MGVIDIENVCKTYKLYRSKKEKLIDALSPIDTKLYKEFKALDDVSFSIEKGECVGLIGLNGSGKSTLLKIITGVITQTRGEIIVKGKISALLELGAGFNPEYSGLENIYLNSTLMGYTKEETDERISEILDFADIGEFIYQPVKTYSSGMFVRLAFSLAINVDPEILIIDEALSVGDVFFQQKCYKKIKELSGRCTVLMVSHDMGAMTKFCNRVILLNHGTVAYDGDPQEAVTQYYKIRQGNYGQKKEISEESGVNLDEFKDVDRNAISGALDVVIEQYYFENNGIPYSEFCHAKDDIEIKIVVNSKRYIKDLIVGYQVRDKFGTDIFGQNTLTSKVDQFELDEGRSIISIEFTWPKIQEGDYFITLGIGKGLEVLNQVEECWVNNMIHVYNSNAGEIIYGIINQDIENYTVARLKG